MKYLLFLLLLSAEAFSQPSFPVRYYTKGDSIGVSLDWGINWYHKSKVPSEFELRYPLGKYPKTTATIHLKPPIEKSIEFDGNYCYRTKNGKREKIPCAPLYTGKDTFPELKDYGNAGPNYTYALPVHKVRYLCKDRHGYERCAFLPIGSQSDSPDPLYNSSGVLNALRTIKAPCAHKWVELHQDTATHTVYRGYLIDMHDDLQKRIVDYEESIPLICLICHEEKKKIIHYKRQP